MLVFPKGRQKFLISTQEHISLKVIIFGYITISSMLYFTAIHLDKPVASIVLIPTLLFFGMLALAFPKSWLELDLVERTLRKKSFLYGIEGEYSLSDISDIKIDGDTPNLAEAFFLNRRNQQSRPFMVSLIAGGEMVKVYAAFSYSGAYRFAEYFTALAKLTLPSQERLAQERSRQKRRALQLIMGVLVITFIMTLVGIFMSTTRP